MPLTINVNGRAIRRLDYSSASPVDPPYAGEDAAGCDPLLRDPTAATAARTPSPWLGR
jgi:hypothetical protein